MDNTELQNRIELSARMLHVRRKLGLSQTVLGRIMNCARMSIYRYEKKLVTPKRRKGYEIKAKLKILERFVAERAPQK